MSQLTSVTESQIRFSSLCPSMCHQSCIYPMIQTFPVFWLIFLPFSFLDLLYLWISFGLYLPHKWWINSTWTYSYSACVCIWVQPTFLCFGPHPSIKSREFCPDVCIIPRIGFKLGLLMSRRCVFCAYGAVRTCSVLDMNKKIIILGLHFQEKWDMA